MQTIEDLITQSPAFDGLAPAHLELIAGCGENERADVGTFLFREGEPAQRFWLIRSGSVALEVHAPGRGQLRIQTLEDGEVLGWSWLFSPYRWATDARVLAPTDLVKFDGACVRGKADADHEFGYELLRRFTAVIVGRLHATRLQLLDVYGDARAAS
jgi:CRP/FNR family transcriptional regulator, cyclic AMP receptor protein